jgi:hypothetical protein
MIVTIAFAIILTVIILILAFRTVEDSTKAGIRIVWTAILATTPKSFTPRFAISLTVLVE